MTIGDKYYRRAGEKVKDDKKAGEKLKDDKDGEQDDKKVEEKDRKKVGEQDVKERHHSNSSCQKRKSDTHSGSTSKIT